MDRLGERYLSPAVSHEMSKPVIDLRELPLGSEVAIVLAEDEDALRQAKLKLRFKSAPTNDEPGKFEVIDAELDPEIIELNSRAGIPNPERMGGEIWVNFACTFRRGYMPPITMAQNHAIAPRRHLFMWIPAPSDESPHQGIEYRAEVLEARVL